MSHETPRKDGNIIENAERPSTATKVNASSYTSSGYPFQSSALFTSTTGQDLMQSRLERLDRERVDLSLQLHGRQEKDREQKLKIESLENKLKHMELENSQLIGNVRKQQDEILVFKYERNELEEKLKKINEEKILTQEKAASEVWSKTAAASRELKRVVDELLEVKIAKNMLADELGNLKQILTQAETVATESKQQMGILVNQNDQFTAELSQVKDVNAKLTDDYNQINEEMTQMLEQLQQLATNNEALNTKIKELTTANEELNKFQQATLLQQSNLPTVANTDSMPANIFQLVTELKQQLYDSEQKRRKLHSQLQDLKGNVRVFVRCRPFLTSDHTEGVDETAVQCNRDETSITLLPVTCNNRNVAGQQFFFDKVFSGESNQEVVYSEVSQLIQSALDGYRVCVFSYGQTGSGKVCF